MATPLGAKKASLFSQYRRADETLVFVNQYSVMLSRMSSRVRPSDWAGKNARHERLTGGVVVEYPGRQADRRICKPAQRLRPVRHLDGVSQAMLVEKGEPIE